MSSVTINYQNATLTATTSSIMVSNGTIGLSVSDALSLSGTISFSSLYITSGAVSFNVESGAIFNAAVNIPVSAGGSDPLLEVTNFAGSVFVTWPTSGGLQTQTLSPGDPLTLSGYVG